MYPSYRVALVICSTILLFMKRSSLQTLQSYSIHSWFQAVTFRESAPRLASHTHAYTHKGDQRRRDAGITRRYSDSRYQSTASTPILVVGTRSPGSRESESLAGFDCQSQRKYCR